MSFELPNLDNRSYDQLLVDLVRRIPQYTQAWTDYNDSDPGITLLQMLCWIDESLLYQANAIPLQTQQNFLRWVLGLAFSTNQTPYSQAAVEQHDFAFLALQDMLARIETGTSFTAADLQRAVLGYVHHPYLALSLDATEALARETNAVIAEQQAESASVGAPPLYVRRADAEVADQATAVYILSNAQWTYRYPSYPNQQQNLNAAHSRRKVLLVQPPDFSQGEQALLYQVRTHLAPRVLAGSAVHVLNAQMTPIDLAVVVLCEPEASLDVTLTALTVALFQYFLPDAVLAWPYGKAPDAAQVQQLIQDVAGVERILRFDLNHIPTLELDVLAQLGVNTLLAALPPGAPDLAYRGLPRLRCLDVTVTFDAGVPT